MNRLHYLLSKIAEEATEVAQITLKTQQFGLDERYQNGPSNVERMQEEITDLLTVIDMLNREFGTTLQLFTSDTKRDKVNHYYRVARHETPDEYNIAAELEPITEQTADEKRMDIIGQNGNDGEHY